MSIVATEVLNSNESVADETIKVDSVAEPSKLVKQSKPIIKNCKVLYWNKDSKNFAFQYGDKEIQIILSEPLKTCGATVKVECVDGKYKLLENRNQ